MQMRAFPHPCSGRSCSLPPWLFLQAASVSSTNPMIHLSSSFVTTPRIVNSRSIATSKATPSSYSQSSHANSPNIDSTTSFGGGDDLDGASVDVDVDDDYKSEDDYSDLAGGTELSSIYGGSDEGIEFEIEKIGKNSRRIRSSIAIEASLQTVWNILTDYERLADFIPGLAVCQLLEKRGNFARLFQIGQQKLAFGINFNAKGILDCYEKDLESLPFGQRRDIEFKMIEGDFQLFEGKWSVEQYNLRRCEDGDSLVGQELHTTLSYVVDVEPKLWLPVRLVEGRLGREIKMNLSCIRVEAQKSNHDILDH